MQYLKTKFPQAEVFESVVEKNHISVRKILAMSNLGKNDKGENIIVPVTDTKRYHIDTVRVMMLNDNITKEQILKIMKEHLLAQYDNGTITDGGIIGGEETAEAIINLITNT